MLVDDTTPMLSKSRYEDPNRLKRKFATICDLTPKGEPIKHESSAKDQVLMSRILAKPQITPKLPEIQQVAEKDLIVYTSLGGPSTASAQEEEPKQEYDVNPADVRSLLLQMEAKKQQERERLWAEEDAKKKMKHSKVVVDQKVEYLDFKVQLKGLGMSK